MALLPEGVGDGDDLETLPSAGEAEAVNALAASTLIEVFSLTVRGGKQFLSLHA